jgi:1,4-alpha-glucan branching enzyme
VEPRHQPGLAPAGRPGHAGVQRLVRDLNRLYTRHPALHALDCDGRRLRVDAPRRAAEHRLAHYGGSNVGTPLGRAGSDGVPCDGRPQSIVIDLPPLATVFFEWTA